MAVTRQKSTQIAAIEARPIELLSTLDSHGRVRCQRFDFTQSGAGDATSKAELCRLPAGRLRLLRVTYIWSAFGASRTLDIGHDAYSSGVAATNADGDAFVDGADVAAAGRATAIVDALMDSDHGILVLAEVAGGTIPNNATISGFLEFVQD